jgi:hypothetical protein
MDPKGKGMVVNDKEESLFNKPKDSRSQQGEREAPYG